VGGLLTNPAIDLAWSRNETPLRPSSHQLRDVPGQTGRRVELFGRTKHARLNPAMGLRELANLSR
jgi:hypothetical protein